MIWLSGRPVGSAVANDHVVEGDVVNVAGLDDAMLAEDEAVEEQVLDCNVASPAVETKPELRIGRCNMARKKDVAPTAGGKGPRSVNVDDRLGKMICPIPLDCANRFITEKGQED
jgi:hypothetical protein